jgi:hypothetical protein
MFVVNEAERSQPLGDRKYDVITRYCKLISEKIKFSFAPGPFGKGR